MKGITTKLASPTRLGLQSLRNIWRRLSVALMLVILTATSAWATITGSGTQQDPYIIHDASDWNTVGQDSKYYYNDGTHVYVELADDIDFSGTTFRRFGQNPNYTTPSSCYIHFDGKGHTIRNISMNQGSNNYAAPFGDLATGSTISNLTVASSSFSADKWVAGITCKNEGTITNCHVESTVTLTANNIYSEYCGGIAAQNGIGTNIGTITNCTVGAKFVLRNGVNEQSYGGIVGYNYGASPVSGCLCYSTYVTSNLNFFKILIGHSYNNGDVVTNNYYRPVGNYGHGAPDATTTHVRAVSGIPSVVTVSPTVCVSHGGYGYFAANSIITLTAPAHKLFTNDFSASGTDSGYTLSGDKTTATVTIATSDVTVNATVIFGPDFIENSDGSYTIKNANGWSVFCDLLEENAKGYFDGKTVKLDDNISVTRMAGTSSKPFTGTFDGNKKTLTVNYSGASYVAPFRYVDGATIQNLVVEGTISSSGSRAAGVIGETGSTGTTATSHITNCVSSSTISGDRYTGGFSIGGNVEIEGCVFNGKINGSELSGGFVGYSNSTLKIKNCLFAPQSGSSISGGTFYYNGGGEITPVNSYYTEALGTAQGTQARRVTGDQYVTTCTVSPKGSSTDTYDLSGITAYNDGIVRDNTFYYGDGDQVSLTLAHSDRNGYTFSSYAPSAGTLNGTTLTMPNADVTIGCNWTAIDYTINYILDGGSVDNPTSYNIETPDFTLTDPTKEGYHFVGWTKGNNSTLLPTVTIEQGSTGNLDYTAHYKTNNFTVGDFSYQWTSGTQVKVTACNPNATSVTIPTTVTNEDVIYSITAIDATAFSGCSSLLCLILNSETPPALGSNAFSACTALNAIGVPAGTAAAYKAAAGWSDYEDMIYAINGTCGDDGSNVYYSYDTTTKTLNIFGTGAMANYNGTNMPWYSYCTDITTVVIGNGVTSIGDFAFYTCTSLKSVEIPASVTTIGASAFWGCTSLISVEIPANVTYIEYGAFCNCTGLFAVISWAVTPPTLGSYVFDRCMALNAVGVPAGSVEAYKAADGWRAYYNVTYAVDGTCGTNVYYSYNSNTKALRIFGTGAMADYDGTNMPWYSYRTDITKVAINRGVTSIGDYAFNGCTGLTNVTIPAHVTSIGDAAFSGCTNIPFVILESATPPSLGSNAYDGCTALNAIGVPSSTAETYKATDNWKDYKDKIQGYDGKCGSNVYYAYDSTTKTLRIFGTGAMEDYDVTNKPWQSYREDITTVVINHGVTSIGSYAFEGCTSLKSVEIPDGVTSIGERAFAGCTSLESLEIPASVTSIGECAFAGCTSLESVEIPASVTSIGVSAFIGCSGLESISVESGNTVYDSRNSCNALIETNTNTLLYGCKKTVIPGGTDGVTSIGWEAFANCTGLTSVEIPASVTSIGDGAFWYCTGLTTIEIPASVTSIGDGAFEDCISLASVTIPASVTSIGDDAFIGCSGLESISVESGNTVYDSRKNCNAIIETNTNTLLYVCKNTVIPDGSDGVTSIGTKAFAGCTSLESIEIPASVTSIGYDAFAGCTSLESIEIPASVTSIGGGAFQDCTDLSTVTIYAPELGEYDGFYAFYGNAEDRKIYVFKNCLETYKAKAEDMKVDEDDILAITGINLRDNDDNSTLIAAANDNALGALDVTLKGRTLYKDGAWNTLCLPFDVTLEGSPLEGAIAKTLVSGEITDTETNLTFGTAVTTLQAGTPYIIKWDKPTGYNANPTAFDIVEPTFTGVTVVSSTEAERTVTVADGQVKLVGYYDALSLDPENGSADFAANVVPSIYYMTADNTLKHTAVARTLHTCRAYFQFDETADAREIRLNFGEDETTEILSTTNFTNYTNEAGAWYTVDGVKLDKQPTRKGLYIFNGKKVVIK